MKAFPRVSVLLLATLLLLASTSRAQNNRIDPEGVQALKDLVAKYQNISSYSDKTLFQTNLKGLTPNTSRIGNENVSMAWTREHGFRIESKREGKRPHFVARGNDQQMHLHWFRHTGTDSDTIRTNHPDFLNYSTQGLPFEIPGLDIFTGGITVEQLAQLPIDSLTMEKNFLYMDAEGNSRQCKFIQVLCTNDKGQRVDLTFAIGNGDGVLYMFGKGVADGSELHGTLEIHSDISFGASFPDEYWSLDFPLMGEEGKVTPPPPLTRTDIVRELPTLTAQDINGRSFTVSPDNKKAVLFYFFSPGGARQYIDDVQLLHEEGEIRGLQVIGVVEKLGSPAARTREAILAFMAEHHITFPICFEEAGVEELKRQLGNTAGGGPEMIYGHDGQLKSDARYYHTHELRAVVNFIAPIIAR